MQLASQQPVSTWRERISARQDKRCSFIYRRSSSHLSWCQLTHVMVYGRGSFVPAVRVAQADLMRHSVEPLSLPSTHNDASIQEPLMTWLAYWNPKDNFYNARDSWKRY